MKIENFDRVTKLITEYNSLNDQINHIENNSFLSLEIYCNNSRYFVESIGKNELSKTPYGLITLKFKAELLEEMKKDLQEIKAVIESL